MRLSSRPPKLTAFIIAALVGGLVTLVLAVWSLSKTPQHASVGSVCGAVLVLVLACTFDVPLRWGGLSRRVSIFEGCLVVALSLAGASPWLVFAAAAGTALRQLYLRKPPDRLLTNLSTTAVGTGVAVLIAMQAPSRDLSRPAAWAFLAAAGMADELISIVATSMGIAFSQRRGLRLMVLQSVRGYAPRTSAATIGVGILAVGLERFSPITLVLLPPLLFAWLRSMRHHLDAVGERDAMTALMQATAPGTVIDEVSLLPDLCARAVATFGAVRVRVVLCPSAGSNAVADERSDWRSYVGDGNGGAWEAVDAQTVAATQELLALDSDRAVRDKGWLRLPLRAGGSTIGELGMRFDDAVTTGGGAVDVGGAVFASATAAILLCATQYESAVWEGRHDRLTGLSNRQGLEQQLDALLAAGIPVTLLSINLDGFSRVNGTLGYEAGDTLLRAVGARLTEAGRDGDLVARLGADDFAVAFPGNGNGNAPGLGAARRMLDVLSEPVDLGGLPIPVQASIGVAGAPEDATDGAALLRCADTALSEAKRSGHNAARYRAVADERSAQRLALLGEMQAALAAGDQLILHFQPKVDLASAVVIGAEALVRWQHPRRGLLQPNDFVPEVECSGFIHEMTRVVLASAVAEAVRWAASTGLAIGVAVNVSPRCLLRPEFADDVAGVLALHGLPGRSLTLEITETVAMLDIDTVSRTLDRLRSVGIRLSVDDFGTGYSSLTFLQRVAVDEIKIDRAFVATMETDAGARAIIKATSDLARSLDLSVVAEGVETASQLQQLRFSGCGIVQGYYVGRPMSAQAIGELVGRVCEQAVLRSATPPPLAPVVQLPQAGQSRTRKRPAGSS